MPSARSLTALKSLSVSAVAATGHTQEHLERYGWQIAAPDHYMNGEEHTVAVGAADSSGNRYTVADDSNVIYQVAGDTVNSWADATDGAAHELCGCPAWDASAVTFSNT